MHALGAKLSLICMRFPRVVSLSYELVSYELMILTERVVETGRQVRVLIVTAV